MQNKFSFFRAPIRNVVPSSEMTVQEVFEYVTSDVARERTLALRRIADRKLQQNYKAKAFDYITPSALCRRRGSGGLTSHSGWVVMDIDHLESEKRLLEVKLLLVGDDVLRPTLIFRSPSGDGLKVWYRVPEERLEGRDEAYVANVHKAWYEVIAERARLMYDIECDHTCDVMRACYLCYDPDAYFDESTDNRLLITDYTPHPITKASKTFSSQLIDQFTRQEERNTKNHVLMSSCLKTSDWEMVESLVRGIEQVGVDITGDYHQWMRIGFALASAFGEEGRGFYHRVSRFYVGYSNRDCNRQYDRCLKSGRGGVGLGTFMYLAKSI